MVQSRRAVRLRPLAALASLAFVLVLSTCENETAGPGRRAALAVQAELPPAADLAGFGLTIDNIRLIVVRPPSDTAFDSTFAFGANVDSLQLTADVPLEQSPETFRVTIQMLSGVTLLFSGTQDVDLTSGQSNPPAQIPVTYAGPGQNVASLTIGPLDSVLSFGGSLTFRPTALDGQGQPVPSFYVSWTTSDTAEAKVDATGKLIAPSFRTTVNVLAHTPNNVSASTPITFIPVPNAISVVSGCGQSGLPGVQLPQPIVVKVLASDGLGVKGVTVQFTAPAGGSVVPAQAVTDVAGLAQTVATLGTGQGGGSFSISASGIAPVACNQVVQNVATQLAFTTQPTGAIVAGTPMMFVVVARDAVGNVATSFTGNVTLAIGNNPGGSALSGTTTVAAVAGVATFTNMAITKVGVGYTLLATSGTLAPATSTPFDVIAAAPAQLAFSVQPSNVQVGSPIVPPVVVAAQDAFGNPTPSFGGTVTVAIGTNPGGAGLGGAAPQPAIAGLATFSALTLDKAAAGYTLVATSGSLTAATSTSFTVTAVAGLHLVFTTQPSAVVAGSVIAPAIVVTAEDGQNAVVPSFTSDVTLTFGTCGGATLGGTTTITAVAGVASFADLSVDKAGACNLVASSSGLQSVVSAGFTVSAGAAAKLAFTVQPSSVAAGAVISPVIQVSIQDGLGNTVLTANGNVTIGLGANPGGATLGGTKIKQASAGVALFADLTLDKAGTAYTLVASSGTLTSATSTTFDVTTGTATQLVITTQPSTAIAGVAIAPPITVEARDGQGNLVSTFTGAVTVALLANPGSATLAGTTSRAAAGGIATFDDLSLDKAANGYTIRATSGALTAATSAGFNVTAAAAAKLAFTVQPASALQGATIAPPVAVAVQDGFGNTVAGATNSITIAIGTNPNGGTLSGATPVSAVGGLATFGSLSIDNPGTGYTLQATATGLSAAVSAPFDVLPLGAGVAWINAAGGNWSVPANWSPARVPAKGDTVFITLGGTYTVTLDVNDTVAFLTVGGSGAPTLTASSRTFGVDSGGSIAAGATVSLTNTTLNGAGVVANQGTLNLQSSVVNSGLANLGQLLARSSTTLNGALTTGPASTIRVEGDASCCGAFVTVANSFTNNGAINLTAINGASGTAAQLTVTNGTLTNAASGTINSLPGTGGARTLTAALDNQGALTVSQPLTINHSSAAHTNSGTITLAAALTLNQSGTSPSFTHSGTLVIPAGDTLFVNSGAFNYTAGTIGGLGAMVFSSAALTLTPGLTNDTLSLSFTNSTVNGPGTLSSAATRTLFAQNSTFNGPVSNQGVLLARSSTTFNGLLTTAIGSTLRVEGDASCCGAFVTVANSFTNNGAINLTAINGASGTTAQLTVTNGTLTNAASGTINSLPGTGGARTLTATLDNQGALTMSQPLTINHSSAAHTNGGTITLAANLTLSQSGTTPSFTHSGTLVIPAGDTLFVNSGAFNYTAGKIGGLGAVVFSSAALTLTPGLTNDTLSLSFTNSTVNGPGTLSNAATRTLFAQNSTFNGPVSNQGVLLARSSTTFNGLLTTAIGSTLRVEGDASCCGAFVTVANSFTNNGAINLTAINGASGTTAQLTVTNGTLTNAASGTINSLPGTGGARTLTAQLDNQGALTVSQPLTINHSSAAHTNSGTITLAADLTLSQSGTSPSFTHSGTLVIPLGDTLFVNSGAFNYTAGTIGGLGAVVFSSVTLALTPGLTNDTLSLSFTNSTVNGPGTLSNAATRTLFAQNTAFNGPVSNQGVLLARSSTSLNGSFTTSIGSTLRVEGDASCCGAFVTVANGFTNNGAINLTAINGASGTTAQLTVTNGTLTNAASGTINSLPGTGGARTLTAQLDNQGALTVSQPLTINHSSAAHTNSGTITVTADLTINQSGTTPSFTNTGGITIGATDTLIVTGGAFTQSAGTLGGAGVLELSSVNPAAFSTAHGLGGIVLLNTTVGFATPQSTLATQWSITNSTVNGAITFTNDAGQSLTVQGSTFNTAFDNLGSLTLRASSALNGAVTTGAASALVIQGDASCCAAFATVANGFTNNGTIDLTAINGASGTTAQLTVTNGTLTNVATGSISSSVGTGGSRVLSAALNNQGTLTVSQPLTMNHTSAVHSNSGTITVAADLTINQSGTTPSFTTTGILSVAAGDTVLVTGGAFTQGAGTLGGAGALELSSVNPGAFATAHSLGSIVLLNTTVSFATAQSSAATRWSITNSTVNGPITFTNNSASGLTVQASTFNTTFANQAPLTLRGTSALTGSLTTNSSSAIVIQGDASCCAAFATLASGFTNNGTITLTAINGATGTTAQLTVTSGTLTNAPGASITSAAGTGGSRVLTAAVDNLGTLTVNQPLTVNQSGAVHTNESTGIIDIAGGDLTINQSGSASFTNIGAINLPAGRTWTVTGGAWTHSGPTLGSGGALVLSSVNPAVFNTAHTLGAVTLTNTTATFVPNQSTATTTFALTNAVVNGPGTLTNAVGKTLVIQGGTLNTPLINDGLTRLRGSLALKDTIITSATSTLRVEGDASCCATFVTVDSGFTNKGKIELTAINGTGTTASLAVDSTVLVNAPGATIDVLPGTGGARNLNVALDNQGTMTVAQALTMNKTSASIANSGLIKLAGGDWSFVESGFRPAISNTGTIDVGSNKMVVSGTGGFTNQPAGTLQGSGTIDVSAPSISFITDGTTTVGGSPGILNFVGPYLMGPTGTVNVEIGGSGSTPGVTYDQLTGTDNVTLQGGTLNATVGLVAGQTYTLISLPAGKTITGDFSTKIGLAGPKCTTGLNAGQNQYLITCP